MLEVGVQVKLGVGEWLTLGFPCGGDQKSVCDCRVRIDHRDYRVLGLDFSNPASQNAEARRILGPSLHV